MSRDATDTLCGSSEDNQVCNGVFGIAQATQYLLSRCDKMDAEMADLQQLINDTIQYTADNRQAANKWKQAVVPDIKKFMNAGHVMDHAKCDPKVCVFNSALWKGTPPAARKAAKFTNYIFSDVLTANNAVDAGMQFE
jgi:hypothetical protein